MNTIVLNAMNQLKRRMQCMSNKLENIYFGNNNMSDVGWHINRNIAYTAMEYYKAQYKLECIKQRWPNIKE